MRNNNQSNNLIKWGVIIGDFLVLNILLAILVCCFPQYGLMNGERVRDLFLICNLAMVISQYKFHAIIHLRQVGADSILKLSTLLVLAEILLSYLLLRIIHFGARIGWQLLVLGVVFLLVLIIVRFIERWAVKKARETGRNSRSVTLVGNDDAIVRLKSKLLGNPTFGYQVIGYYGDLDEPQREGSIDDFMERLESPNELKLGDEVYLCIPRREYEMIGKTIRMCGRLAKKFYYVPLVDESMPLQPIVLDDLELYAAYTSPLDDPLNKLLKRLFDLVFAMVALVPTVLLCPLVYVMMKKQSPGPLLFKQKRTGLDGKDFVCYKFRSMHVNSEADKLQATADDPRKYPFGNFMRKTNIDEMPQFWNVLKGDMSVVGPRPHMLAHTEQYSKLIDKYMVRHFVKPGVTGWAQVTGFRGETKELWQKEGRVERDIWYMQHWSLWLDLRIVWMTVKTIFVHDEKAY